MASRIGWNLQLAKYFSYWRRRMQHPRDYYNYRLISSVMIVWRYNSTKTHPIKNLHRSLRLIVAWHTHKSHRQILREIAKNGSALYAQGISKERLRKKAFSYWRVLTESSVLTHAVKSRKFHRHINAKRKDTLLNCFKCWNVRTKLAADAQADKVRKLRALLSLYTSRSERLQSELRSRRDGTPTSTTSTNREQRAFNEQMDMLLLHSNHNTI